MLCLDHGQHKKRWVLIASSLLGSIFAVGKETLVLVFIYQQPLERMQWQGPHLCMYILIYMHMYSTI